MTNPATIFEQVHAPAPMSTDDAAAIVVAALREPGSPPLACLGLLLNCYKALVLLWKALERKNKGHLSLQLMVPRYRLVFACTMRFLCAFRSAEQFRALKMLLQPGHCTCAEEPESLHSGVPAHCHSIREPVTYSGISELVVNMGMLLRKALLRRGKMPTLYKQNRRKAWPGSTEELFPHGPATVHNLVRWIPVLDIDTGDRAEHVQLISHVFSVMPCYTKPGLFASSDTIDWLYRTSTAWCMEPRKVQAPNLWSSEIAIAGGVLEQAAKHLSYEELRFWLSSSTHHSVQDMCTMLDRTYAALATDAIASDAATKIRGVYADTIGRVIYCLRDVPCEWTTRTLQGTQKAQAHYAKPLVRLYLSAYGADTAQRCYGPGCIQTYASRDLCFMTCGGCRVAAYCSWACQKAAWRHPQAPHRELCRLHHTLHTVMYGGARSIEAGTSQAWGSLPDAEIAAACRNAQRLGETQLERLKEAIDEIRTDKLLHPAQDL